MIKKFKIKLKESITLNNVIRLFSIVVLFWIANYFDFSCCLYLFMLTGAWSAGGDLATARNGLAGAGSQTAGLCMGGSTGADSAVTEEYDGATWSSGGNLAVARYALAGAGSQTAGLCMGGDAGSISAVTEEYDKGINTSKFFLLF